MSPRDIRTDFIEEWQAEWDNAEVSRFAYRILMEIEERLNLKHMDEVDLRGIQLLTPVRRVREVSLAAWEERTCSLSVVS